MIIRGAVWLARIIVAVVSKLPIPWTVAKVIDTPEDERHQWTEEEMRNARGM